MFQNVGAAEFVPPMNQQQQAPPQPPPHVDMVQAVMESASNIIQAKVCKAEYAKLVSGKGSVEQITSLTEDKKSLRDQLYAWMRARKSLCSTTAVSSTEGGMQEQCYVKFEFKYEYPAQTPQWLSSAFSEFIADGNLNAATEFQESFKFHVQAIQCIPGMVSVENFFRRMILDALLVKIARIKTKMIIDKSNPNSTKRIKRVRPDNTDWDADSIELDAQSVKYARGSDGQRVRLDNAPIQKQNGRSVVVKAERGELISYYTSDKYTLKKPSTKPDIVSRLELVYLQSARDNNATTTCILAPLIEVGAAQIYGSIEKMMTDDRLSDVTMERRREFEMVNALDLDAFNGDLRRGITKIDSVSNETDQVGEGLFVEILNRYIRTSQQLEELKAHNKHEVDRKRITPEALMRKPATLAEQWSRNFDNKDDVAFWANNLVTLFTTGTVQPLLTRDNDKMVLRVPYTQETGEQKTGTIEFVQPGQALDKPLVTLKWNTISSAIKIGFRNCAAQCMGDRDLSQEMVDCSENQQVGQMLSMFQHMVTHNLVGHLVNEISARLLTAPTKKLPFTIHTEPPPDYDKNTLYTM